MTNYTRFTKVLKKDWYTQGFNANPFFLNHAAFSGFTMRKQLGFSYSAFLFRYQNGFGEMSYLDSDYKKIWRAIKKRLLQDPNYLRKVKEVYLQNFQKYEKFFSVDKNYLRELDNKTLVNLFKKVSRGLIDSVGIAHILDAINVELEKEFKKDLLSETKDAKNFNKYYSSLSTPSALSFVGREELELEKIARLPKKTKEKKLEDHAQKYFWLQNSYAGPKFLTVNFFRGRLKKSSKEKEKSVGNIKKKKSNLIQKLKLSRSLDAKIDLINFAAIWQDERKANILKVIGYSNLLINELAARLKVKPELLYQLGVLEATDVKTISDIKAMFKILTVRSKGVFFLMEKGREYSAWGQDFARLDRLRKKQEFLGGRQDEIHGSIACSGTAIGRVIICNSLAAINKVKDGDVIVASMTRPEYMPALKKASAIITDEGGVTCHAAIVARELNIPAVIGTKVATKLLKNGMQVEVKGNHGVVRILK